MIPTRYRPTAIVFALALALPLTARAYYNPNAGRWVSRDPIEESGGVNLYFSVANDPVNQLDPLGQEILAVEVVGDGPSRITPEQWAGSGAKQFKELITTGTLGYHGGNATEPIIEDMGPGNRRVAGMQKLAIGLVQFEYRIKLKCSDIDRIDVIGAPGQYRNFTLAQYVTWGEASAKNRETGQYVKRDPLPIGRDGPSFLVGDEAANIYSRDYIGGRPVTLYSGDYPRIFETADRGLDYVFSGYWRFRVEDNDNAWEGTFKVAFQFSDSNPAGGKGTFRVMTQPHEVKR